ncbi:hypothetical protein [Bacillus sp. FJAT-22090]|uniref:hypothetical protein n=1 Tax=Bacillus sp. FJAT-22090 TaxID=1581038 RepID=UPI0011A2B90F|nr:hypothetical protein [Bacillus sp. FJAT-22090]
MKIVISIISTLLVIINSTLLLFQYHVYSSSKEEGGQSFFYEQEIEIKLKKDKMIIKQHFSNLPKEQMVITWPISSENRSCDLSTSDSCSRLSEDLALFNEGDMDKQSISYEIPIVDGLRDGELFTGFLAKIENGGVSYTTLHVTDEVKRGGMWISGLPIIGSTSLSLIDYTLFFGTGNISELYWQKESIPVKYENDYFTVHSNENLSKEVIALLDGLHIPNNIHMSMLFTENKYNIKSSRIAFIANKGVDAIQSEIIVKNIQLQYGLNEENPLLAEVVSSFIMASPIGSEKSIWMYETLKNYFTKDQLSEWETALTKTGKLNAEKLDKLLSKVIGLKTSFFAFNGQEETEQFPLLFEDARPVYLNKLYMDEMNVVFKDGKVLYAAGPLLTELGYTLDNTDKGLYVQSSARAFRFPVHEPFYVLNEKRYDAMSEPFEKIGTDFYMEEAWMIRLFLVNVDKQKNKIIITPSDSI